MQANSVYNGIYNGKNLHKHKISIFGSKIHPNEVICDPRIEEDQTKPVYFVKKNQFDQEKFEKLEVQDFAFTMELHCIGNILNHQLKKKSLIKMIFFFYKTDWFSLVLLYMWVIYELILRNFNATMAILCFWKFFLL